MQATETTKDRFYISATAAMADTRRLILKDENLFGLFDRYGDIVPVGTNDTGLYYEGMRYLSSLSLRMEGRRLLFLSSGVDEDNLVLSVDLTNPDISQKDRIILPKDSIHLMRSRFLYQDTCFDSVSIRNFSGKPAQFHLELALEADFKDIFEIRGMKRKARGTLLPARIRPEGIELSYRGLDDVVRTVSISGVRPPDSVRNGSLFYAVELQPEQREEIQLAITCSSLRGSSVSLAFSEALAERRHGIEELNRNTTEVQTSNERFNESLRRSLADISMMLTRKAATCG